MPNWRSKNQRRPVRLPRPNRRPQPLPFRLRQPFLDFVAAVGQRRLMDTWADAFEPFNLPVAQLLLTREDIDDRTRFLNVRNTIHAAHELGAIPIVNENDTVSTDELVKISFGDNDILAAMVTHALRANLLVLLTVVDGLLDADGRPVRLSDLAGVCHVSQLRRPGAGRSTGLSGVRLRIPRAQRSPSDQPAAP